MKIFQFAFANTPSDPFLPHNYPHNCVAYTGTHDNDTAHGWYDTAPEEERDFFRRYTGRSGENVSWDMIRAVWSSVAMFAIAPLQDFLSLDSEARMNFPGKPAGNWDWRVRSDALDPQLKPGFMISTGSTAVWPLKKKRLHRKKLPTKNPRLLLKVSSNCGCITRSFF
jgi:4-alpha-glucanotransferase